METRTGDWDPAALLDESEWMRALALRLVQDVARADDLVQETLVAALRRRPAADRPLRPWLARVLRNRLASERRNEARVREREEACARPEGLPSSAELLERASVQRELAEALTRLREPYRSVLLLRYHEGLEPAEIARRRGVPAATVRSQLSRALAELRAGMDRSGNRSWCVALVPFATQVPRRAAGVPSLESFATHVAGGVPMLLTVVTAVGLAIAWPRLVSDSKPLDANGELQAVVAASGDGEAVGSEGRSENAVEPEAALDVPGVLGAPGTTARSELAPAGGALQATGGSVVTGRILDRSTREPLPYFGFVLGRSGSFDEFLQTDAEGHFEGTLVWDAGRLRVDYFDCDGLEGVARSGAAEISVAISAIHPTWDPVAGPLELLAPSGPRHDIELTAQDPGLAAELAAGELQLGGTLALAGEPSSLFGEAWTFRAPLREEEPSNGPWIRFAATHGVLPTDRPWVLGVVSSDGLVGGEVEVPAGDGATIDGAAAVVLERRARLDVSLVSGPDSIPIVGIEGEGRFHTLEARERNTGPDGRFEWLFSARAVSAGDYRLHLRCEGLENFERDVELVAGEALVVDAAPAPSVSETHVAGMLKSDSGSYAEAMFVRLRDAQGRPVGVVQPRWMDMDGQRIAPFRFDGLEPGDYLLDLRSSLSNWRWSPASATVRPPLDELALVCHDEEPAHSILFRVFEAASGRPWTSSV